MGYQACFQLLLETSVVFFGGGWHCLDALCQTRALLCLQEETVPTPSLPQPLQTRLAQGSGSCCLQFISNWRNSLEGEGLALWSSGNLALSPALARSPLCRKKQAGHEMAVRHLQAYVGLT